MFSFKSRVLVPSFRLSTSSTKRECRDENGFLKFEKNLRKFNSNLQYYKIGLSFNIKFICIFIIIIDRDNSK